MTFSEKIEFLMYYVECSGAGMRLYRHGFRNTKRNRLVIALWLIESGKDEVPWGCDLAEIRHLLERKRRSIVTDRACLPYDATPRSDGGCQEPGLRACPNCVGHLQAGVRVD